jgi:hypothetical protein
MEIKKLKHLIITKGERNFYACNEAVIPTKEKSIWETNEVTCKNCLRFINGHHVYSQIRKFNIIEEI